MVTYYYLCKRCDVLVKIFRLVLQILW